MRMSISTTSGRSSRQRLRASWPVEASPTILMKGSADKISRRPARARSWSSTMMTLALFSATDILSSTTTLRRCHRQRQVDKDQGSLAWLAPQLEPTAEQGDSLSHPVDADLLARGGGTKRTRVEALPPVPDPQAYRPLISPQLDAQPPGFHVLAGVRQGFLCDPKEGGLD